MTTIKFVHEDSILAPFYECTECGHEMAFGDQAFCGGCGERIDCIINGDE